MKKEYNQFALDSQTNKILHISEVKNGKSCGCICLSCNHPLIAKHGNIKIHHFAHQNDSECKGSNETLVHLLTKEIIYESKKIFIPRHIINSNKLKYIHIYEKSFFGKTYDIDNIQIEKKDGLIQPDIICDFSFNNKKHSIQIEIAVTHFVEKEKEKYLKQNKKNSIEIDLSEIYENIKKQKFENINNLKDEIKKYIYHNPYDITYFINQNIINDKDERELLNKKIIDKFNLINRYIIENINENFLLNYNFQPFYHMTKKDNFFGKYNRYIKREPFKNKSISINKIITKDFNNHKIIALINCYKKTEEFTILINPNYHKGLEKKEISISFDIDNLFKKENLHDQDLINIINKYDIELYDDEFYNSEYILSEFSPEKELKRYNNFIQSIKNKKITFPNPCFKYDEIKIDLNTVINVPNNLLKKSVDVLISNVEIPDRKNPNILKLFYNKNQDYMYLIFSSDINNIKFLDIYKERFKNKKSILFYKFNGNTSFYEFKDFIWNKDNLDYEWIYHKSFENLKIKAINESKIDFKEGISLFYKKYKHLLKKK